MNNGKIVRNACLATLAAALLGLGPVVQGDASGAGLSRACAGPAADQNPHCAAFTWTPSDECTVDFEATGGDSFAWDFGDGTTGTGSPISHRFPYAGPFTVTMSASSRGQPRGTSAQVVDLRSPGIGAGAAEDAYRGLQWALDIIQATQAWAHSTGRCVIIALTDTGVDRAHPDLQGQLLPQVDFVTEPQANEPCNTHGTRMAGVAVAAANNGIGLAGIAPNAKVLPLRTTCAQLGVEKGVGRLAAALHFAADNGARVVSISLGYDWEQATQQDSWNDLLEALEYAYGRGLVLVAAAGNGYGGFGMPYCMPPASHERTICVGATTRDDERAEYSNFDVVGADHVMAPGGEIPPLMGQRSSLDPTICDRTILVTVPLSIKPIACEPEAGYAYFAASTSTATPHVSGVAALLVAMGLTGEEVVTRIKCTADDLGLPGRDPVYGWGRVNAFRAVTNDRNVGEPGC